MTELTHSTEGSRCYNCERVLPLTELEEVLIASKEWPYDRHYLICINRKRCVKATRSVKGKHGKLYSSLH